MLPVVTMINPNFSGTGLKLATIDLGSSPKSLHIFHAVQFDTCYLLYNTFFDSKITYGPEHVGLNCSCKLDPFTARSN